MVVQGVDTVTELNEDFLFYYLLICIGVVWFLALFFASFECLNCLGFTFRTLMSLCMPTPDFMLFDKTVLVLPVLAIKGMCNVLRSNFYMNS